MEQASSPSTPFPNLSLAQTVVSLSINVFVVWLSALLKFSSCRRRSASVTPATPPKAGDVGPVDLDVVLAVMGTKGGEPAVPFEEAVALFEEEEASIEEAAAAFRVFDRDSDGFIDAGELGRVLRSLGFAAAAAVEDCRRMIAAYDENKDGRIDFHEFVKFMERST